MFLDHLMGWALSPGRRTRRGAPARRGRGRVPSLAHLEVELPLATASEEARSAHPPKPARLPARPRALSRSSSSRLTLVSEVTSAGVAAPQCTAPRRNGAVAHRHPGVGGRDQHDGLCVVGDRVLHALARRRHAQRRAVVVRAVVRSSRRTGVARSAVTVVAGQHRIQLGDYLGVKGHAKNSARSTEVAASVGSSPSHRAAISSRAASGTSPNTRSLASPPSG